MSVIIRLQNLPWSANALDIRNFFRGLSIPEGGVHIVGGELGDAFIAFSTDEDARQAMMMDGGKIKEIQVKLFLSSRSEMHKVIETARQSVPLLTLATPAPAPVIPTPTPPQPQPVAPPPIINPFSTALGNSIPGFGIPGIGNPQEIPQPAVIEPPGPLISPPPANSLEEEKDDDKLTNKRKDRRRTRSRSRSRDKERKDRKRNRRDRSRSRERRRRDRSRSRDRRDRKRDRKDRSRSRDRSPSRRARDKRNDHKSPLNSQDRSLDGSEFGNTLLPPFGNPNGPHPSMLSNNLSPNGPGQLDTTNRFNDPTLAEAFNKLQELGKKRNPNAFQGDQNGGRFQGRDGNHSARGGGAARRDARASRFEEQQQKDCCVAIRNAPNHTSYGDVRRFFPFMIDKHGIKMINDNTGRRTGNIFVRFCDPRSKQLALQRKINELKGSQVNVEELDDDTYEAAVDSFLPYREENDEADPNSAIDENKHTEPYNVLKLTDLPNFVKEHEIMKVFSDFTLLSIQLTECRATRKKVALVQFVQPEDAKAAYDRRDTYLFGRRQATVTPISSDEFEKEKSNQDKSNSSMIDRSSNENSQEAVMPRDPRQRRQQADNGSGPGGMLMQGAMQQQFMPNAPYGQNFGGPFPRPQFGGFSGSGNMEGRSAAGNWVGNRMSFPKQSVQGGLTMKNSPTGPAGSVEEEPLDCVLMKGLPREATDRTIVNFLADTGAVPARIHLMLDANSLPSGDCFCEFRSAAEARKAATKHGQQLDGCRITIDIVMRSVVEEALEGPKMEQQTGILGNAPPPFMNHGPRGGFMGRPFRGRGMFDRGGFDRGGFRGGFDQGRGGFRGRGMWSDRGMRGFDRGRGRGFNRGRGGFDHMPMQMPVRNEEEPDPGLENFGAPGCVVSMENVPFRASVDDILTFFSEFELTQDDVIRRYNERGQPTGDARVAFRTPFDAQRAIKTRHMTTIHDRTITLNIL